VGAATHNGPWTNDDAKNFSTALQGLYELWNKPAGDPEALNSSQRDELGKIFATVDMYIQDEVKRPDDHPDLTSAVKDTNKKAVTTKFGEGKAAFKVGESGALESKKLLFGTTGTITKVGLGTDGNINVTGQTHIAGRLFRFFNDENFQQFVSNAITHGQTSNDQFKQKLKKTMFIYQEFIKSAGTIMEKISEMIKNMANKVGR
jgi:hypothetical protein